MKYCCENERGQCRTHPMIACDCCESECARLGICRYEKARLDVEEQKARIAALKRLAGENPNG